MAHGSRKMLQGLLTAYVNVKRKISIRQTQSIAVIADSPSSAPPGWGQLRPSSTGRPTFFDSRQVSLGYIVVGYTNLDRVRMSADSLHGVHGLTATASTTRQPRPPRLDGLSVDSVRRIIYAYTDSTAVDIVHASASTSPALVNSVCIVLVSFYF